MIVIAIDVFRSLLIASSNFALYGINVYASAGTLKKQNLVGYRFKVIKALNQFSIGNFIILPFDTQHDAAEPLGFLIQYKPTGEKLIYATDTYYIKYKFNKLNYLLLECNYNKEIAKENAKNGVINKTRYSRLLESHFSLENVIKFLKSNDLSYAKNIVLCHLSDTNSNQDIMLNDESDEIYLKDIKAISLAINALKKCPDIQDKSFNCRMCGKELKTWKSIQKGFGPVCERKYLNDVYKNQQMSFENIVQKKGER